MILMIMYNLLATVKFLLFTCSKPSTDNVSLEPPSSFYGSSLIHQMGVGEGWKRAPQVTLVCLHGSRGVFLELLNLWHNHPQGDWRPALVKKPVCCPRSDRQTQAHFSGMAFQAFFPVAILLAFRGIEPAECPHPGLHL